MTELKENFLQNPTDSEIFSTLEIDYTTSEAWTDLIEIYDAFLNANDDNEEICDIFLVLFF